MQKKHTIFIILGLTFVLTIILILSCIIYMHCSINFSLQNFNRAIYSVVIHNNTNMILDDIQVFYGSDINNKHSVVLFESISNIKPDEYRKINIPTDSPDAQPPYNVWLCVQIADATQTYAAGYFGEDTGGLAVFKVTTDNDVLNFQRIYQHEKIYKYIYKRNKKNQQELSWFD